MKVRTIQHLIDKLDKDIAWRKKELVTFKATIDLQTDQTAQQALRRSGVALLYSHWEGFVKNAGTYYLEYVSNRKERHVDLCLSLQTVIAHSHMKGKQNTTKASCYGDIFNNLYGISSQKPLPYKGVVKTDSNLSSQILKEICWVTQLDYSIFETSQQFIDEKLLGVRNGIAHGEGKIVVDAEDYAVAHQKTMELIEQVKEGIEDNAIQERFKASSEQHALHAMAANYSGFQLP